MIGVKRQGQVNCQGHITFKVNSLLIPLLAVNGHACHRLRCDSNTGKHGRLPR
jgi:hypothetical protein